MSAGRTSGETFPQEFVRASRVAVALPAECFFSVLHDNQVRCEMKVEVALCGRLVYSHTL